MPIKEVPMYRATCDVCGKDDGDDTYYAWADAGQARERWQDGEFGPVLDDGRLFCDGCVPADVCRLGDGAGKHSPSDDGLSCVECDRPLAPVAAVSAPPEEDQK